MTQKRSRRMRRLLASGLLSKRAGQPVKALVHIYFAELLEMDRDSALQSKWIAQYRARWAAHRGAASVTAGDGGAWLEGDAAQKVACDAMIIPVVTGDIDPAAVEELIVLCVRYHRIRTECGMEVQNDAAVPAGLIGHAARRAEQAAAMAEVLAELEHQILGKVLQVVSGPGGVASFLRRNLLGNGLGGPSLPLATAALVLILYLLSGSQTHEPDWHARHLAWSFLIKGHRTARSPVSSPRVAPLCRCRFGVR
jgi:hypothetical protein